MAVITTAHLPLSRAEGAGKVLPLNAQELVDPRGNGYLAGDGVDGVSRIEGVPASAEVRIIDRASGLLVDSFDSEPDGTWRRERLELGRPFDVVYRSPGYNDGVVANVTPADAPRLTISGSFLLSSDASQLTGSLTVSGGTGPYSVDIIEGTPPPGISFGIASSSLSASGRVRQDGSYSWTFKVTDVPSGRYQTRQMTISNMVSPDLMWSANTHLILPNAADFGDIVQGVPWSAVDSYATPTIDSSISSMGRSLRFLGSSSQCLGTPAADVSISNASNSEMTIEFWFYATAGLGTSQVMLGLFNSSNSLFSWSFYWHSSNTASVYGGGSRYLSSNTILALNTRYHFAWVREQDGDRLYLNGKLEATGGGTAQTPANRAILGAYGDPTNMSFFTGFIQGLRISRIARYRNNFIPPQTYKAA